MPGKYDKILYEILDKTKVKEGMFIALDGPLGPGLSTTITPARIERCINALEAMANQLRWLKGIPTRKPVTQQ